MGEIDKATDREPVDLDGLEEALRQGDRKRLLALMGNDLELVTLKAHPGTSGAERSHCSPGSRKGAHERQRPYAVWNFYKPGKGSTGG